MQFIIDHFWTLWFGIGLIITLIAKLLAERPHPIIKYLIVIALGPITIIVTILWLLIEIEI